jgi:hypothetical protein
MGSRDLVPVARWGDGERRAARRELLDTLKGVGQGETVFAEFKQVFHARRSLTPEEMEFLSPEWLAIPARDEFSEQGGVEKDL